MAIATKARKIGNSLNLNPDRPDFEDIMRGAEEEMEHFSQYPA